MMSETQLKKNVAYSTRLVVLLECARDYLKHIDQNEPREVESFVVTSMSVECDDLCERVALYRADLVRDVEENKTSVTTFVK